MSNGFYAMPNCEIDDGIVAQIGARSFCVLAVLRKCAGNDGRCFPSYGYLQKLTGFGRSTISRALDRLVDAGLIVLIQRGDAATKRANEYQITSPFTGLVPARDQLELVSPRDRTSPATRLTLVPGRDSKKTHNKKTHEKDPSSCRRTKFSDEDMSCAKHIWDLIQRMQPGRKKPNLDNWANDVRLMRECDKRTHEQIRELFEWANADDFWRTNILSPGKLRKQWDQLDLKRGSEPRNGKVVLSAPPPAPSINRTNTVTRRPR